MKKVLVEPFLIVTGTLLAGELILISAACGSDAVPVKVHRLGFNLVE